ADLFLERRPLLYVNLTAAGLTCLGLGLAVGLTAVALRRTTAEQTEVGRQPVPLEQVKERATEMVARTTSAHPVGGELRYLCTRLLALACHAAVISGLFFIGWRHFQDTTSGVAMATLYLLLPYTAYHIDQLHHVWPSAFVVWAVAWYRRPLWTGALLGVATGTSFFPLFLLPAWWGFYSGRGSGRFLLAYLTALLLSTAVPVSIYWLDGSYWRHFVAALHLWDWIPWRVAASEGIWTTVHWAYRLPVFVVFIALVIASAFWPHPKNLAHQIALNAAILLGLQFWHADCGGVYILWYLPLLILLVCRPNLTLAEPPLPAGSMISWLTLWTHRRTTSASTTSQELAV
ncbi:MAG: hypothetical protein NZ703_03440, partial [Gemmataceae bacterium]|nr:hypothetical protein [Gemmataceae bacterium]